MPDKDSKQPSEQSIDELQGDELEGVQGGARATASASSNTLNRPRVSKPSLGSDVAYYGEGDLTTPLKR